MIKIGRIAGAFLILCALTFASCDTPLQEKTALTAPSNVMVNPDNFTLTWNPVSDAAGYVVNIDGQTETVTAAEYPLERLISENKVYQIKVQALAQSGSSIFTDSAYSNTITCEPAHYIFEYSGKENPPSANARSAETLRAGDELTITGLTNYGQTLVHIVIPDTIGSVTVAVIGEGAFEDNTVMVSVVIAASVKAVEKNAFKDCEVLTTITFSKPADTSGETALDFDLGDGVFDGCTAIETIIVPDGSADSYKEIIEEKLPDIAGDIIGKIVEQDETTPVTGVTLSDERITLKVGSMKTLTPAIRPGNATNKNVTWNSSNENIAVVNTHGTVQAVGQGTAVITVTTEDGRFTAECTVTVEPGTGPGEDDPQDSYQITFYYGEDIGMVKHGTVSTLDGINHAPEGTEVFLSVNPDAGYKLYENLYIFWHDENGDDHTADITLSDDGTYSFTMPNADITVAAMFYDPTAVYKISSSSNIGGEVTVSTTEAKAGDSVTVTMEANDGYTISGYEIEGLFSSQAGIFGDGMTHHEEIFTMPPSDVEIFVTFVKEESGTDDLEYKVTVELDPITEKQFVEANSGTITADESFIIRVESGYTIDAWYLNNELQQGVNGNIITLSGLSIGEYRVKVVAVDRNGVPWSNDLTITVESGTGPGKDDLEYQVTVELDPITEKQFVEANSGTITADESFTIRVESGYTIDAWYLNNELQQGVNGNIITLSGLSIGEYHVKVVAVDRNGVPWSNDLTITVIEK